MVGDMAGFLHHLDQQHGIVILIEALQGGEVER
jgi:hypothetical protein